MKSGGDRKAKNRKRIDALEERMALVEARVGMTTPTPSEAVSEPPVVKEKDKS